MTNAIFLPYYDETTETERRDGRSWYDRARVTAYRWSKIYGYSPTQVAGIIAVLSQRKRWSENLLEAEKCLQGTDPRALRMVREKAIAIRDTGDLSAIRGPKVRAFYHAIMGDMQSTVLDTWMLACAALSNPEEYGAIKTLRGKRYQELARVLQDEAAEAHELPAHFQAIVWGKFRGSFE